MVELKIEILPSGETKKARDNAKGHLLEKLVSEYLGSCGYSEIRLNQKVFGTEWDVTGKAALSHAPVIVSCKYLSTSISPEPLKAIGFDVYNLSDEYPSVSGVLIALPRISSDSKTYWSTVNKATKKRVRILEEPEFVEEICNQKNWFSAQTIKELVKRDYKRTTGDSRLIYCEYGAFWVQLTVDHQTRIPDSFILLSTSGEEISDTVLRDNILELFKINESELSEYELLKKQTEVIETIQSIKLDSQHAHLSIPGIGWFDYKYPAPSDHFAGREHEVEQFDKFVSSVINGSTAGRVAIITGISGIGKSSIVLKFKDSVSSIGGRMISINCISAKGRTFLLQAVVKMLQELEKDPLLSPIINGVELRGLDSLPYVLMPILEKLRALKITPILFFDQFETALLDGPLAEEIVAFVLALEELRANMIIGFAWKTDLWWPDDHVPYTAREKLRKTAFSLQLDQFGPNETNILLKALSKEITQTLNPGVQNEIRLFSRGYPWLLKKVCWHLIEQINRGTSQIEILDKKLDLRTLFESDLEQLDESEKDLLKKIAPLLPADGRTISEVFSDINIHDGLNKFTSSRLLVKQGDTYNIYHDIFKEFLRTGRVPIEESYLLKVSPIKSLEVVQTLINEGNSINVDLLSSLLKIKVQSLYNYVRSLVSIGYVVIKKGIVSISKDIEHIQTRDELIVETRKRLVRNTCAREIIKLVNEKDFIHENEIVAILKKEFPSLPAQEATWIIYARMMVQWLNHTQCFGRKNVSITGQIKSRKLIGTESVALYPQARIYGVHRLISIINDSSLKKAEIAEKLSQATKTAEKHLVDARLLGLTERLIDGSWRLTPEGRQFLAGDEQEKKKIIKKRVMNIPLIKIIFDEYSKDNSQNIEEITSIELLKIGKNIKVETQKNISNCIKNWLEYCGLMA